VWWFSPLNIANTQKWNMHSCRGDSQERRYLFQLSFSPLWTGFSCFCFYLFFVSRCRGDSQDGVLCYTLVLPSLKPESCQVTKHATQIQCRGDSQERRYFSTVVLPPMNRNYQFMGVILKWSFLVHLKLINFKCTFTTHQIHSGSGLVSPSLLCIYIV